MIRWSVPLTLLLSAVLIAPNALAMQPLPEFIASAKRANYDIRETRLVAEQRAAEAAVQGRKLLPVLSARGVYTHNQYEAVARSSAGEAVIVPQNQLDAFFSLDVPIVDLAQWERNGAANRTRDAAKARAIASEVDIEQQVTRLYYDVLAARGVVAVATRNLETSESNRKIVIQRHAAGLATELDLARTIAEEERNKQAIASARYNLAVRERQLATQSGMAPSAAGELVSDDLHPEASLATFLLRGNEETPALTAARLEAKAAERTADAQWYALAPSLAANATERITNATGFAGRAASYQLSATLTWRLDASTISAGEAQSAAKTIAALRRDKAERLQQDAVRDAYELVTAQLQNCRAARAETEANATALKLATDRYNAGTALQLDVLQASRQLFASEIARLQADADLAFARASLHLTAGKSTVSQ
jgi:outer membrane protein TolC